MDQSASTASTNSHHDLQEWIAAHLADFEHVLFSYKNQEGFSIADRFTITNFITRHEENLTQAKPNWLYEFFIDTRLSHLIPLFSLQVLRRHFSQERWIMLLIESIRAGIFCLQPGPLVASHIALFFSLTSKNVITIAALYNTICNHINPHNPNPTDFSEIDFPQARALPQQPAPISPSDDISGDFQWFAYYLKRYSNITPQHFPLRVQVSLAMSCALDSAQKKELTACIEAHSNPHDDHNDENDHNNDSLIDNPRQPLENPLNPFGFDLPPSILQSIMKYLVSTAQFNGTSSQLAYQVGREYPLPFSIHTCTYANSLVNSHNEHNSSSHRKHISKTALKSSRKSDHHHLDTPTPFTDPHTSSSTHSFPDYTLVPHPIFPINHLAPTELSTVLTPQFQAYFIAMYFFGTPLTPLLSQLHHNIHTTSPGSTCREVAANVAKLYCLPIFHSTSPVLAYQVRILLYRLFLVDYSNNKFQTPYHLLTDLNSPIETTAALLDPMLYWSLLRDPHFLSFSFFKSAFATTSSFSTLLCFLQKVSRKHRKSGEVTHRNHSNAEEDEEEEKDMKLHKKNKKQKRYDESTSISEMTHHSDFNSSNSTLPTNHFNQSLSQPGQTHQSDNELSTITMTDSTTPPPNPPIVIPNTAITMTDAISNPNDSEIEPPKAENHSNSSKSASSSQPSILRVPPHLPHLKHKVSYFDILTALLRGIFDFSSIHDFGRVSYRFALDKPDPHSRLLLSTFIEHSYLQYETGSLTLYQTLFHAIYMVNQQTTTHCSCLLYFILLGPVYTFDAHSPNSSSSDLEVIQKHIILCAHAGFLNPSVTITAPPPFPTSLVNNFDRLLIPFRAVIYTWLMLKSGIVEYFPTPVTRGYKNLFHHVLRNRHYYCLHTSLPSLGCINALLPSFPRLTNLQLIPHPWETTESSKTNPALAQLSAVLMDPTGHFFAVKSTPERKAAPKQSTNGDDDDETESQRVKRTVVFSRDPFSHFPLSSFLKLKLNASNSLDFVNDTEAALESPARRELAIDVFDFRLWRDNLVDECYNFDLDDGDTNIRETVDQVDDATLFKWFTQGDPNDVPAALIDIFDALADPDEDGGGLYAFPPILKTVYDFDFPHTLTNDQIAWIESPENQALLSSPQIITLQRQYKKYLKDLQYVEAQHVSSILQNVVREAYHANLFPTLPPSTSTSVNRTDTQSTQSSTTPANPFHVQSIQAAMYPKSHLDQHPTSQLLPSYPFPAPISRYSSASSKLAEKSSKKAILQNEHDDMKFAEDDVDHDNNTDNDNLNHDNPNDTAMTDNTNNTNNNNKAIETISSTVEKGSKTTKRMKISKLERVQAESDWCIEMLLVCCMNIQPVCTPTPTPTAATSNNRNPLLHPPLKYASIWHQQQQLQHCHHNCTRPQSYPLNPTDRVELPPSSTSSPHELKLTSAMLTQMDRYMFQQRDRSWIARLPYICQGSPQQQQHYHSLVFMYDALLQPITELVMITHSTLASLLLLPPQSSNHSDEFSR